MKGTKQMIITRREDLPEGYGTFGNLGPYEAKALHEAARTGRVRSYKLIRAVGQKRGPVFINLDDGAAYLEAYRAKKDAHAQAVKAPDPAPRIRPEDVDNENLPAWAAGMSRRIESLENSINELRRTLVFWRTNAPSRNQMELVKG